MLQQRCRRLFLNDCAGMVIRFQKSPLESKDSTLSDPHAMVAVALDLLEAHRLSGSRGGIEPDIHYKVRMEYESASFVRTAVRPKMPLSEAIRNNSPPYVMCGKATYAPVEDISVERCIGPLFTVY